MNITHPLHVPTRVIEYIPLKFKNHQQHPPLFPILQLPTNIISINIVAVGFTSDVLFQSSDRNASNWEIGSKVLENKINLN